jgi:surface antigen
MCQADKFIATAVGEIGYIEGPADNETKYQKANQPWCGAFVNWCAKQVGLKIPDCTYTPAGAKAFADAKRWQLVADATPLPGDLAFFDFPADGIDRISHIGIVEEVKANGTVIVIEGNTSPDVKGDQRNGGQVCRKIRAYKVKNRGKVLPSLPVFIVGFGRPKFKECKCSKKTNSSQLVAPTQEQEQPQSQLSISPTRHAL